MKTHRARHYDQKYNQFPYQNQSQGKTKRNIINSLYKPIAQGITMRNIINSLIKTHRARHYDIKFNQFPNQNPSQGITMGNIIDSII